jgi:hypothetical protein
LDFQGVEEAEVLDPAGSPLRCVRTVPGRLSQIQAVSNLLPLDGEHGADSGREESKLVTVAAGAPAAATENDCEKS